MAKQAWKRGAVVQRELLVEMEQLKAHQRLQGGGQNSNGGSLSSPKWQTWGIRNTSFPGGSSGVPSEHCRPWLLVTGHQLRSSGGMVQLPCGMALHSALTMVALMPRPKHQRATPKQLLSERLEFVVEVLVRPRPCAPSLWVLNSRICQRKADLLAVTGFCKYRGSPGQLAALPLTPW